MQSIMSLQNTEKRETTTATNASLKSHLQRNLFEHISFVQGNQCLNNFSTGKNKLFANT